MARDDRKDDWWRGGGKKKNRHRQRRKYRELRWPKLSGLTIVDSRDRPRIIIGCSSGKEPLISMLDEQGNPRIHLSLSRGSAESAHDGRYSVEHPAIVLMANGQRISIGLRGSAEIAIEDEFGRADLETIDLPAAVNAALRRSKPASGL